MNGKSIKVDQALIGKHDNTLEYKKIESEDKKYALDISDRRHERNWFGWIIVIAIIGCIVAWKITGPELAHTILNIASVLVGYMAGKVIKK
jgi:ABC-type phosphate/phosphonate transport system permease subunit